MREGNTLKTTMWMLSWFTELSDEQRDVLFGQVLLLLLLLLLLLFLLVVVWR